jgi:hypothetical protein
MFDKEDIFFGVLFFCVPYYCSQACIINAVLNVCNVAILIVISAQRFVMLLSS